MRFILFDIFNNIFIMLKNLFASKNLLMFRMVKKYLDIIRQ